MGINFENPIGNPRSYPISRVSSGINGIQKKQVVASESFLDLFKKISDSPEPSINVSDQSQAAMEAKKALALCRQMELQMNESVLRIMSDIQGENRSENSLMDEFGEILSKGQTGEDFLSKIRQTPSENDLSQIQLPDPIIEKTEKIPGNTPDFHGIEGIIQKAAKAFGVDSELIRGVIQAESNFNPKAVSPKGAMGLMQLMPATAKELEVKDPFNPDENVMGGTRYLKKLLDRYDGSVPLALAAYNWGMGNLDSHPSRMPVETRNYVAKITGIALT